MSAPTVPVQESAPTRLDRRPLFALAVGAFGLGLTEFVMMGLLPQAAANLDVSIPQAGYLVAAYALGVVIGAPLLTVALRQTQPRRALALLMLLFTAANLLTALVPGYHLVLLTRLLAGLPHGAFFGVGAVLATRIAPKGKAAQAMSLMFTGMTLVNVVGVPLGTFLGQHFSWRVTFLVVAVVGVAAVLSVLRFVPPLAARVEGTLASELAVFRRPLPWLLILSATVAASSLFTVFSYVAPFVTRVSGLPAGAVPFVLVVGGLGFTVGNLLGGRLADWSPLRTIYLLLALLAVTCAALALLGHVAALAVALLFVITAACFALVNPVQLLLMRTARGAEALGSASSQSAFNMGNAAGAYLGGLPIAAGLGVGAVPWVGAGVAVIGLLLMLAIGRQLRTAEAMRGNGPVVAEDGVAVQG